MNRLILCLSIILTAVSCNREVLQEQDTPQSEKRSSIREGYKISEDDALDLAESAADLFSIPTKSGIRTAQKSIPVVVENNNRQDTLIYIVNYTNDNGYVLISPDARSGEILAFIEQGSLSVQDTVNNTLQKFLLNRIISYQASQFEQFKRTEESEEAVVATKGPIGPQGPGNKTYSYLREMKGNSAVCQRIFLPPGDENDTGQASGPLKPLYYYEQSGCYGTRRFSQLLTPKPGMLTTAWNQTAPFNDNAPLMANGVHSFAGCVAVAVAQIMAYHSFPAYYPNGTITSIASLRKYKNWNDFSTVGKQVIATFLRKIGDLLHNEWQTIYTIGTAAYDSDVPPCFATMGYKNPGNNISYNLSDIIESLDGNMPVYISGCTPDLKSCHAWVIDGYKILNRGYDIFYFDENAVYNGKTNAESYLDETYLSCNFGWGGSSNGYYLEQAFNTDVGPVYKSSPIDTKYNFNRAFTIIPYIHN